MTRRWPIGRRLTLAAAGIAMAFGPIGCSSTESSPPAGTTTTEAATPVELSAQGTLAVPDEATNAYTYDPALAPPGAKLSVTVTSAGESTTAKLDVAGFLPDRGYAVHLHTNACGPTGDAAGPHFQNRVDPAATPEQPSTDPEYANPDNEFWLDLRTNAAGSGTSRTEVPFVFINRAPASVVVHKEMMTATEPGRAGTAGSRIACLTLPNQ